MADATCADLRIFMNKLGELRKEDDLIGVALNNRLPTKSFPGCKQSKGICEEFQKQLSDVQTKRRELILRCCDINERKVSSTDDPMRKKLAKMTLRQMKNELEVEKIVSDRSTKAVNERCNKFI